MTDRQATELPFQDATALDRALESFYDEEPNQGEAHLTYGEDTRDSMRRAVQTYLREIKQSEGEHPAHAKNLRLNRWKVHARRVIDELIEHCEGEIEESGKTAVVGASFVIDKLREVEAKAWEIEPTVQAYREVTDEMVDCATKHRSKG